MTQLAVGAQAAPQQDSLLPFAAPAPDEGAAQPAFGSWLEGAAPAPATDAPPSPSPLNAFVAAHAGDASGMPVPPNGAQANDGDDLLTAAWFDGLLAAPREGAPADAAAAAAEQLAPDTEATGGAPPWRCLAEGPPVGEPARQDLGTPAETPAAETATDEDGAGDPAEVAFVPPEQALRRYGAQPTTAPVQRAAAPPAQAPAARREGLRAYGTAQPDTQAPPQPAEPAGEQAPEDAVPPSLDPAALAALMQGQQTAPVAPQAKAAAGQDETVAAGASVAAARAAVLGPEVDAPVASAASASVPAAAANDAADPLDTDAEATPAKAATLAELGAALAVLGASAAQKMDETSQALDALTARALARPGAQILPARVAAAGTTAGPAPDPAEAAQAEETDDDTGGRDAAQRLGALPTQQAPAFDAAAQSTPDAANHRERGADLQRAAAGVDLQQKTAVTADTTRVASTEQQEESGQPAFAQAMHQTPGIASAAATTGAGAQDAAALAKALPQAEVSRELADAVGTGTRHVQLRLAPPGIGEVAVQIRVVAGQVHMRVHGDSPELAQMLRQNMAELQEGLQAKGLVLQGLDFGGAQNAAADGQQAAPSNNGGPGGQGFGAPRSQADGGDPADAQDDPGRAAPRAAVGTRSTLAAAPAAQAQAAQRVLYVTL